MVSFPASATVLKEAKGFSDAEYGLMVDILDELKLANARRIALKTMKGG